jgi:hypothetical protein
MAASSSPISSRKTLPWGPQLSPVPEELRLDQRGRERRQVEGVEALGVLLREGAGLLVEGHVARQRDRARDELLAGAGLPDHQGGDVGHALVERAPIAGWIMGEHRLPHAGPQLRRRHRAPEDLTEGVLEGAPDLEPPGEQMPGRDRKRHGDARDLEEAGDVGGEARPRRHAPGRRLVSRGAQQQAQELVLVAPVEQVAHESLVLDQLVAPGLRPGREPLAQVAGEALRQLAQARDVGVESRDCGVRAHELRVHVPDLGGADVLGAERARLRLDPLGQEGVHAERQAREGPQHVPLAITHEARCGASGGGGGAHGCLVRASTVQPTTLNAQGP